MFLATTQVVARATSSTGRRGCAMKISFSMVELKKTAAAAGTKCTYGVTVNGQLTGPAVGKRVSGIMVDESYVVAVCPDDFPLLWPGLFECA